MKTLIIHPKDPTTTFLKPIYTHIPNKTIIEGGKSKNDVHNLIESHDRVIMLGHGSPDGLFTVGQFASVDEYIIDESMVKIISKKTNNIFIWCYANEFVKTKRLNGFCTGMFISELIEAWYYEYYDIEENLIEESNNEFARIVSKYIDQPLEVIYKNLVCEYGLLARTNPIAQFNLERIFLNSKKNFSNSIKFA